VETVADQYALDELLKKRKIQQFLSNPSRSWDIGEGIVNKYPAISGNKPLDTQGFLTMLLGMR